MTFVPLEGRLQCKINFKIAVLKLVVNGGLDLLVVDRYIVFEILVN